MTCKAANLLTFRPFWSHNPIVLSGDIFDENRMPACCHLSNLSDVERHSSKMPVQETPIFSWRINGSSGAGDEAEMICGMQHREAIAGDVGGWHQPNPSQCHSRL